MKLTHEEKLKAITRYLDQFLEETDKGQLIKDFFEPSELSEIKGARRLALDICIKFHLEEYLENE